MSPAAEASDADAEYHRSWTNKVARTFITLVWVLLAIVILQALFGSGQVSGQRAALLDQFQQQRNSRVIAMIHREETVSLLGVPVSKFIDI